MTDLTPDRRAALKTLASAATPGPWFIEGAHNDYAIVGDVKGHTNGWAWPSTKVLQLDTYKMQPTRENAEFIAAASPDVVLALLAHLERLEKDVRLLAHLERLADDVRLADEKYALAMKQIDALEEALRVARLITGEHA